SLNVGNVGLVEVIPDRSGPDGNTEGYKRRFQGWRARKNWIIAIIESLDTNDGLVGGSMGIVTGPLAEGTFDVHLFTRRRHFTFKAILGGGGKGKPWASAAEDIPGRASKPAAVVELR